MLLTSSLNTVQTRPKSCPAPVEIKDAKFHPGQVWEYKARPSEKGSRLTILRIESLAPDRTVIHVRVDSVRIHNCTGGPEPETIQHMPFTKAAIEQSVTKLVREGDGGKLDLGGYEEWRAACGGVYTLTVAEAIAADEYTFNKGLGCSVPGHK